VEETFVNVNGASTLKLGQARGAILLALSLASLPVYEYSATMVKKSVVGTGHADKNQVAMMVKTLPAEKQRPKSRRRRRAGGRHLPCAPAQVLGVRF
jgi:crossover junction endodeoxyribonuclease RuvC